MDPLDLSIGGAAAAPFPFPLSPGNRAWIDAGGNRGLIISAP